MTKRVAQRGCTGRGDQSEVLTLLETYRKHPDGLGAEWIAYQLGLPEDRTRMALLDLKRQGKAKSELRLPVKGWARRPRGSAEQVTRWGGKTAWRAA